MLQADEGVRSGCTRAKGKEKVGTQAESVISMYLFGLKKKTMVGKGVFLTGKGVF